MSALSFHYFCRPMKMKYQITTLIILGVSLSCWAQTDQARQTGYNLTKGLALKGYDPVSYLHRSPVEGRSEFKFTHRGVLYLFSSSANLALFRAAPEKYEPAYGGWCAYAMGETGEKVKVDPETYKIIEGKLYLFYNFWGNNTLEEWNKNEPALKARGDQHWKKFEP
jgi:YHS domain-containing protein